MTGSRQYDPTATSPPSAAEVAKGQAVQVAGGAADAAQHVAGVAKEQVGQVAAATGQQVKELAGKAQSNCPVRRRRSRGSWPAACIPSASN